MYVILSETLFFFTAQVMEVWFVKENEFHNDKTNL